MRDLQAVSIHDDKSLLFQQPSRCVSLPRMNDAPLDGRPSKPSGWTGRGTVPISRSRVSSISPSHSIHKEGRGVRFQLGMQSIDRCYPDESNSIKRALQPGPRGEGLIRRLQPVDHGRHPSSPQREGNSARPSLHLCFVLYSALLINVA